MDFLKTAGAWLYGAMPWFTGGVAGAILTFVLNRRLDRRRQARLSLNIADIDYSLPSHQSTFQGLKVSYKDQPHDALRYYQFRVDNISQKTVANAPFVFLLPEQAIILDQAIESGPLSLDVTSSKEPREPNGYRYEAREVKPGDFFQISLLLSSVSPAKWFFRGNDDIDITASDRVNLYTIERDMRDLIAAVTLYVMLGGIPLFAGVFQSGAVFLIGAIIYRIILRWRAAGGSFRSVPATTGPVVVGGYSDVVVHQDATRGRCSVTVSGKEKNT